jgi:16S rRNA (guanine527-N7)-methyltransferase
LRAPGKRAAPGDTGQASDEQALVDAGAALGLALDPDAVGRLVGYCALLRKWNAVYNLTAIRDPASMLVQHLFDCLAIIPPLARDGLADGAIVLDVGSGAGLPGVVIAVVVPGAQVHCVDTVGKKAAFVRQVRAELGLANLHAHHARVEDLATGRDLPAATLIVSRAFASLADFVSLTGHLLAPGGKWAAMKGALPHEELAALPPGVRLAHAIRLEVPRLDARRHLLLLERAA